MRYFGRRRFRRVLFFICCFSFMMILSVLRDNRDDIISHWNNYYFQQSIFLNIASFLGGSNSGVPLVLENYIARIDTNTDLFEKSSSNWTVVQGRRLILKSAYVDENEHAEKTVRILAHKHCHEHRPVQCIFEYADDKKSFLEISPYPAEYEYINHPVDNVDCNQYDKYDAFYVNCRRTIERRQTPPTFVYILSASNNFSNSIESTSAYETAAKLKIFNDPYQLTKQQKQQHYKLIMCISPLYNFNDKRRLKLFLEYYLYQGAEYFLIYHRSASTSVIALIDEYRKKNLVQVIDWPFMPKLTDNDDPNVSVNYVGHILSKNDCLLRIRHRTIYAGLVDVDELIVPLSADSSKNMMTVLDVIRQNDNEKIGGFGFRHSFAYVNWPYNNANDKNFSEFNFEKLNMKLSKRILPFFDRSKVFVKPKAVHKQSVHLVWKFVDGFRNLVISPHNQAILYHLRSLYGVKSDDKSLKSDESRLKNLLLKVFASDKKNKIKNNNYF